MTFSDAFKTLFPPSRGQLSDWLQKRDSHPIMELSYLEVGLGSQTIHMEFDGGVAYTLLVRDSLRCKRFFGLLTGKKKTKEKGTLPNRSKVEKWFVI